MDANGYSANRYLEKYALNLSEDKLAGLPLGDTIGGTDAALSDSAQLGGSTQVISGDVTVQLASTSPMAGTSVPSGASYIPLVRFEVMNGTNQMIYFTGADFQRMGISSDEVINGTTISDAKGNLLTPVGTFGNSQSELNLGGQKAEIPAGASAWFDFNVNIANQVDGNNVTSGTIGAKIAEASDLKVQAANGQNIAVKGPFPLIGGLMNIVDGANVIPQVQVQNLAAGSGTPDNPTEIDQGINDMQITKFELSEVSGNSDVVFTNLVLTQDGSASEDHFVNLRVRDQFGNVIGSVEKMVDNQARFAFDVNAAAYDTARGTYLKAGATRWYEVIADTTLTNNANRTIELTIQNAEDIRVVSVDNGFGVTVAEIPGAVAPDIFPIGNDFNVLRFRQGTLTIARDVASATGSVAPGNQDVALASFVLTAYGEPIELREIHYLVTQDATNRKVNGDHALQGTVTIVTDDDRVIDSTNANTGTLYGTNGGNCTVTNNLIGNCGGVIANNEAAVNTLSVFPTINGGDNMVIHFRSDINQNVNANEGGYSIQIQSLRYRRLSSNTFQTDPVSLNGNPLTINDSDLTVNVDGSYNENNFVAGGSSQKVGQFVFQAGAGEGFDVRGINVKLCVGDDDAPADGTPEVTCVEGADPNLAKQYPNVTNWVVKKDGQVLAPQSTITTVAGTTFSVVFEVGASQSARVEVWATINTQFGTDNPATFQGGVYIASQLTLTSAVGMSSQRTVTAPAVLGQATQVIANGQVNFTRLSDGTINATKLLHADEVGVALFKFQIRENLNAEPIAINEIHFAARQTAGNLKNFSLMVDGQQVGATVDENNGRIIFTGLELGQNKLIIPKGGVKTIIVEAETNDSGTINNAANRATLLVSYIDYNGQTSGLKTRLSGGVYTARAVVDADGDLAVDDTTITVREVNNYFAGQNIFVDLNGDGDFADANETNGGAGYNIDVVDNANSQIDLLNVNLGTLNPAANFAISTVDLSSSTAIVQDVEPAVSTHDTFKDLTQSNSTQIFTPRVGSNGAVPLDLVQMSFEVSGSYASGYGPQNFRLYDAGNDGAYKEDSLVSNAPRLAFIPPVIDPVAGTSTVEVDQADITVEFSQVLVESATTGTLVGVPSRTVNVGNRIKFVGYTNNGIGYRVVARVANGGDQYALTLIPSVKVTGGVNVTDGSAVTPVVGAQDTLAANPAVGDTTVTVTNGAQFAVNSAVVFYDIAGTAEDTNNGNAYRITNIAGNVLTITPGLVNDLPTGAEIHADGMAMPAATPLETGGQVRMVLPAGTQIGVGQYNTYGLVADVTNMKLSTSTAVASLTVKIPGTTVIENALNGVIYSFTDGNGTLFANLSLSDKLPTGFTHFY